MDYGYARVSTRDQDPGIQITALEQAGCDTIVEERASGKAKTDRPVLGEILRRAQRGDTLTVWKLDRLGRSVIELRRIVEDLDHRGVRFRCLTQPIDTSTAAGRFFVTLLAAFAEMERELILERTTAGKAARAARGEHPGGRRRFGFEADQTTIRENEATLLREAAGRLLAGEPSSAIVEEWNDRGVPAQGGGRWQVSPLRTMLTNPRTAPILGQEVYERIVRLFRAPGRQRLGRPAEHLLSGILRCGREDCGQPMYVVVSTKGPNNQQTVYRCTKAKGSGGRSMGCGRVYVSERAADRWAAAAFIAAVCSDDFAKALSQRRAEVLAGEMTAEQLDDWRAEMAELEAIMPTRFGTEDHRRRHVELQRLVREATVRLMRRPEFEEMANLPRTEVTLRAAWDGWTIAERRAWLRRLLHRVTVAPATMRGRGSDVGARLDPVWKL